MIYSTACDSKLSLLGYGTMRLPTNTDGTIDAAATDALIDYAMQNGINYFDTAHPYHNGASEVVIGKSLARFPRESYYLADKYPGHQPMDIYDPAAMFEEQLKKCRVEYFDFYLLHNVYENSIDTYLDPKWDIINYFIEQKRLGRIRHLGFSSHGGIDNLRAFLDICGDKMEFCQIQLNYLDWTLQDAKAKYELLTERGIPVWVMEPVRGGKLASLAPDAEEKLHALRPDESIAAWAFRHLQTLPNVKMVLSGMTTMEQLTDNVKTFSDHKPLNESELDTLYNIADSMKKGVPCTACRYCCDGCPMELDIPLLLSVYNDMKFNPAFTVGMRLDGFAAEKLPSACIGCGACSAICPQKIDIPAALSELSDLLEATPKWADICRQREEAARKLREEGMI